MAENETPPSGDTGETGPENTDIPTPENVQEIEAAEAALKQGDAATADALIEKVETWLKNQSSISRREIKPLVSAVRGLRDRVNELEKRLQAPNEPSPPNAPPQTPQTPNLQSEPEPTPEPENSPAQQQKLPTDTNQTEPRISAAPENEAPASPPARKITRL